MDNSSLQETPACCRRRRAQRRYPFAVPVNNGAVDAARRSCACLFFLDRVVTLRLRKWFSTRVFGWWSVQMSAYWTVP